MLKHNDGIGESSKSSISSTTPKDLNFDNKAENRSIRRPKSDVKDLLTKKSPKIPQNPVLILPDNPANPPSDRTETSFLKLNQPLVGLPNPGNADAKENASFASIFSMKNKSFVGNDIQKRIMKLTGTASRIDSDRLVSRTPGKRKYHEIATDDDDKGK